MEQKLRSNSNVHPSTLSESEQAAVRFVREDEKASLKFTPSQGFWQLKERLNEFELTTIERAFRQNPSGYLPSPEQHGRLRYYRHRYTLKHRTEKLLEQITDSVYSRVLEAYKRSRGKLDDLPRDEMMMIVKQYAPKGRPDYYQVKQAVISHMEKEVLAMLPDPTENVQTRIERLNSQSYRFIKEAPLKLLSSPAIKEMKRIIDPPKANQQDYHQMLSSFSRSRLSARQSRRRGHYRDDDEDELDDFGYYDCPYY